MKEGFVVKNEKRIEKFIEENEELAYKLLKELCLIPSPTFHEEKKAEFCVEKLKNWGFDAYIDSAKNAVCPINCEGSDKITVLCGHTDTVFPDMTPLPYEERDGKIYCPGVGDDTAAVVALLMVAKYFSENKLTPKNGFLIVCNAAEESVGDLKGTKQIMKDFEGRVERFISFDSTLQHMYTECVGGYKFEITAKVQGGHAFGDFGRKNAIAVLGQIISQIYQIKMPEGDYVYSYNVGVIEGGTSVNAIASIAKMQCEYRSNKMEYIELLKKKFDTIIENAKSDDVEISIRTLSDRPCLGIVDKTLHEELMTDCEDVIKEITNKPVERKMGSTDCNIPLSLGIPAVAIGVMEGAGEHTREEWLIKDSIPIGLKVALAVAEKMAEIE